MEFIVFIGLLVLLGIVCGSFFGVLADRLSVGELPTGRSRCDHCGKQLQPSDLIPVYSFLRARGRSSCCNKPLSWWYPGIEILTASAFVGLFLYSQNYVITYAQLAGWYVIVSACIVIIVADFKYHIIPDMMSVVIGISALALAVVDQEVVYRIGAGIVLFSIMYAMYAVTRGKGMGFGDVKFAGVMGLVLGLKDGMLALYLAFVLGGLFGIGLLLGRRAGLKSTLAFGPFLVAGMLVMLLWGGRVWLAVGKLF